jgi:AcrR family transcriptional regulator
MENRAKNLPADERRTVTISAVIELASLQNPSEITTLAIAKHMNLTQGALFRHFPSKESIWQAVMEWVAKNLLARIDRSAEGVESQLEVLQAMFMSHIKFVTEHPGVPRMMFGELQRAGSSPAKQVAQLLMKQYAERLKLRIEQGKTNGEIAVEIDTAAAASLFIGTVQGLVMQSLLSGDIGQIMNNAPNVFAIYQRGIRTVK